MTDDLSCPPGGALALDYARTSGWCYGLPGANQPIFGYFRLPYEGGEGARYNAFEHALVGLMDRLAPARLVMCAPLPIPALNNRAALDQQGALRGIAIKEAWLAKCSVFEISEPDVRRDILGQRYFPKDTVKRTVVQWCHRRGMDVANHDVGDACVLWTWYSRQLTGGQMAPGPLWADA